ncbi:MAG: hypothetical protein MUF58_10490 [Arcicella sp.]|jgi:hypothetical protein|nr:hypothetical protein [Arcicella sp.]
MDTPYYPFEIFDNAVRFKFVSVSNDKKVEKVIIFSKTQFDGIYNLALLDILADGSESDIVQTKNKDMKKVLATVFRTMEVFFQSHPNCGVAFSGSSPERTRLYRIAIARELESALKLFNIMGIKDGILYPFKPNTSFDAFLFMLK